ncbi:MAG: DUF2341 domain-containing protein [Proteobacteria bacterium]|nr:DUF2341 domain-containing protein [Pseudomonadota bacterium]MBU1736856.1 DUF2341 domain-containing protein [Pseudomonadota bacterium]
MKRFNSIKYAAAVLTAFISLFFLTDSAQAWWSEEWQFRKKITFDTSRNGHPIEEASLDAPMLLRFHSGNFDFSKAKQNGADLRFVAADEQTSLAYQIDTYDTIDEIALIWVKVPKISGSSDKNHLWLYYGNEKAEPAEDPAGIFRQGFGAVYHLSESEGLPQDSSPNGSHAKRFNGGQSLPSIIGNGVSLYGSGNGIVVPWSEKTDLAKGFSFSTWLRVHQPQKEATLLHTTEGGNEIKVAISGDTITAAIIRGKSRATASAAAPLEPGAWNHIAVNAQPNKELSLLLNGREIASEKFSFPLPAIKQDLFIGSSADGADSLFGDLDEVHIGPVVRTQSWHMLQYANQGPDAKLVSWGMELVGEGASYMPSYYLMTIARNISLDGWLIIGILSLLGIFGTTVLIFKAVFIYLSNKDNDAFQNKFDHHGGLYCLDGEFAEFDNSPLHRIYRSGCETLQHIFGNRQEEETAGHILTNKEMNTFKASLEKGYIREIKNFNSWMVVMTLAISGGPFLGLLGTVWGVMNTFAAMAEAGEASIMAIAPGIASALATTVFGLIIAIPALFGYNYLTGKIKDLTSDVNIFLEEFILIVDEYHGG